MKTKLTFLIVTLFIFSSSLSGQTEKGKTLLAISTALGIGGSQNGLVLSSNKSKSDDFETDPLRATVVNLSPRAGYFIAKNLVVGLEAFYGYSEQDITNIDGIISIGRSRTNAFGAGPFVRYYIKTEKVLPFFEVGLILGTSELELPSLGTEFSSNLFNYAGGAGIAIPLGTKVSFDALLAYSYFETKPTENNDDNFRNITNAFSLRLGFSIYLGKQAQQ